MKTQAPTPAQAEAMLMAEQGGTATLNRHRGGEWAAPNALIRGNGVPAEFATTATVLAMIRKGMVTVTKTSHNRFGEYPIEVTLSPTNQ